MLWPWVLAEGDAARYNLGGIITTMAPASHMLTLDH